jgi:hypothetical protein
VLNDGVTHNPKPRNLAQHAVKLEAVQLVSDGQEVSEGMTNAWRRVRLFHYAIAAGS